MVTKTDNNPEINKKNIDAFVGNNGTKLFPI